MLNASKKQAYNETEEIRQLAVTGAASCRIVCISYLWPEKVFASETDIALYCLIVIIVPF